MDGFNGIGPGIDPRVAQWLRIQSMAAGMDRLNARRGFEAENRRYPPFTTQSPAEEEARLSRLMALMEGTGGQPTTEAIMGTGAYPVDDEESLSQRLRRNEEAARLREVGRARWAAGRQMDAPISAAGTMTGDAGEFVAPEAGRGGNLFAGRADVTPGEFAGYGDVSNATAGDFLGQPKRFSDILGRGAYDKASAAIDKAAKEAQKEEERKRLADEKERKRKEEVARRERETGDVNRRSLNAMTTVRQGGNPFSGEAPSTGRQEIGLGAVGAEWAPLPSSAVTAPPATAATPQAPTTAPTPEKLDAAKQQFQSMGKEKALAFLRANPDLPLELQDFIRRM